MTDQQNHLITPPPELVELWDEECESGNNSEVNNTFDALQHFASKAARWGADRELEACCEWLVGKGVLESYIEQLRAARRPKPPSLKEQALKLLNNVATYELMGGAARDNRLSITDCSIIRRALEQLDA